MKKTLKKNTHGGKRAGAGRKAGVEIKTPEQKRRHTIQIKLTDAERFKLDSKRGEMTVSEYIRKALKLEK